MTCIETTNWITSINFCSPLDAAGNAGGTGEMTDSYDFVEWICSARCHLIRVSCLTYVNVGHIAIFGECVVTSSTIVIDNVSA